ncbi:hypothetical protein WS69_18555 [Burkholderia sp. BDU5]|nr:hypothetical protein WS69_18555 [Burkholderia sp. BDU5]
MRKSEPLAGIDFDGSDVLPSEDFEESDDVPEKLRGIWVVAVDNFTSQADFTISVDQLARTIAYTQSAFANNRLFGNGQIIGAFENEEQARQLAQALDAYRALAQKDRDTPR